MLEEQKDKMALEVTLRFPLRGAHVALHLMLARGGPLLLTLVVIHRGG